MEEEFLDAFAGVEAGNVSTAIFRNPVDAVSSYEIKKTLVNFVVILVTEKAKTRFLISDSRLKNSLTQENDELVIYGTLEHLVHFSDLNRRQTLG